MDKPTLHITPKKYTGKSSVISIRLPKDMLDDLDRIAGLTGRTRNEIMTMSLEFALTHMDVKSEREENSNGHHQM